MQIRRKDNPSQVMSLPTDAIWTEQGWLVPLIPEMPDDLFMNYLHHEWELVVPNSIGLEAR